MMTYTSPGKWLHILLTALLLTLATTPAQAATSNKKPLTINSGSSAPLIINNSDGFYPKLIKGLFERLNISVQTIHLPSSRSLKNAAEGIDNGMIARVKGLEKKHANLVRVPEKVIDLEFVAFSNNKNIKIEKWADLKPYNVSYIRGWKIFDKNVSAYKSLVKAKDPGQLIGLLKNKRVDVILYQSIPAKYLMNKLSYYPHEHSPYLASREMFIYMHKSNAILAPLITKELKNMKKDGAYKKLYAKYITESISPPTPQNGSK